MKKLSLAFITAGLCVILPACQYSDADKAKLEADAKAAYAAAEPQLKTLATDAAPVAEEAAKAIIKEGVK